MYIPDTYSQSGIGSYFKGTSYELHTDRWCIQPLRPLHLYIIKLVFLSLNGHFWDYMSILTLTQWKKKQHKKIEHFPFTQYQ